MSVPKFKVGDPVLIGSREGTVTTVYIGGNHEGSLYNVKYRVAFPKWFSTENDVFEEYQLFRIAEKQV